MKFVSFLLHRVTAPCVIVCALTLAAYAGVGVGSWQTQVEYKDAKVVRLGTDETLFAADLATAPADAKPLGKGKWRHLDGALRQTTLNDTCAYHFGGAFGDNYAFSVKARKIAGREGFLIIFDTQNDGTAPHFNIGGWANTSSAFQTGFDAGELGRHVPFTVQTGKWYDIRIEKRGTQAKAFIDGKFIAESILSPQGAGAFPLSISVDFRQKGAAVSDSMYGVFFEEVSHSGDGGLYAELIQNRGFEEKELLPGYTVENGELKSPPTIDLLNGKSKKSQPFRWNNAEIPAWSLELGTGAQATFKVTKENPPFAEAPNNLQIAIGAVTSTAPVTLINDGYWGIAVKKGDLYNLRLFIRAAQNYKGGVTVKILSENGATLAEEKLVLKNNNTWTEHLTTLAPDGTDAKAKLALVFDSTGDLALDHVSLFPQKTFRNRPNGLRPDMAEFIAALRPAFVRWPGGCVVEGITLANRYEWKKTLGDPARRPGQYDTWGYRCSYGFGYHEFLQYCEDIGAVAMYVCSVGISCQYRGSEASPESEIADYLKDALDAIEYAIGAVETEWGAKRAAAGHPVPFSLKYIEIGNENWGKEYDRRFDIFYKAIKEKYPQLTIISNHGLGGAWQHGSAKNVKTTDMIDPHWYVGPDFFLKNATIFDKQTRDGPKIYVGEYAVNQKVGGGNMLAALSEAAFISGMERNSDLVKMASYAPLLEHKNDRGWPVNLIWFDNGTVLGRSSYYVQKMYAEHKPNYNLHTVLEPVRKGGIPRQFAIAGYDEKTHEVIIKIVNAADKSFATTIQLEGAKNIESKGRVITLSSKSPKDENSFAEPTKISPKETIWDGFSEKFEYVFKPNSFTIFRIKAESTN